MRSRLGDAVFWGGVALLLGWNFPYHAWLQHANELPRIFMTMAVVEEGTLSIDTYRRLYGYRKTMDLSRSFCLTPRIAQALSVRWADVGGRVHRARPSSRVGFCRERVFSNKAPGQSLLAAPVYAALRRHWRRAGGPADVRALHPGRPGHPGRARTGGGRGSRLPTAAALARERARRLRQAIWAARLTTATLPAFLFLLLLAWWLRPLVPDRLSRRAAVLAYGLGTLAFTYSVQLMSHQLAAALLFSGFIGVHVVARRGAHPAWLLLAGLAGGSALACDYQMVFGGALVVLYALATIRPLPRVGLAVIGAAPPVALLLAYHAAAFGSVTWTGYEFLLASGDQALHHRGWLGMTRPHFDAFWGSLFTPDNGLFYFSPWLLVALGGLLGLWWRARRAAAAAHGAVACGVDPGGTGREVGRTEVLLFVGWIGLYIVFLSSLTFWRGGWQTGPRYVAGMLPVFVLPYAVLLGRLRHQPVARAAALAPALFAIVLHAMVVTGFPHFPEKFRYPLFDLVQPLLSAGYVSENLGHALLGLKGYVSLAPYVAVLALLLLYVAGGAGLFGFPPDSAQRASPRLDLEVGTLGRGGASLTGIARQHWGLALSGVLAFCLAGGLYVGYARAARQGIRRAWHQPAAPGARERYGQFLARAHRDIRRNWRPVPRGRR